jgi:hypothetical protein
MASFTWKYNAPLVSQGVSFKGTYVGAPSTAFDISNTTIYDIGEAKSATSSQWSEKARKVGILISGIPSPIDSSSNDGTTRWGIGIINPLNRDVEIYAVALNTISNSIFDNDPIGIEPISGWSRLAKGGGSVIYWEAGTGDPIIIESESVGQFRVLTEIEGNTITLESPIMIEALSSEGKLTITYNISTDPTLPTLNVFYTKDPDNIIGGSNENWGYQIESIESGTVTIFNATVENTSANVLLPVGTRVAMTILIPSDFTHSTMCTGCDNSAWNIEAPLVNPDGSVFLKVESVNNLAADGHITFQFNATAPEVANDSLYVFQTTSYYPGWDEPQITSALSEAGVEVIPPPT